MVLKTSENKMPNYNNTFATSSDFTSLDIPPEPKDSLDAYMVTLEKQLTSNYTNELLSREGVIMDKITGPDHDSQKHDVEPSNIEITSVVAGESVEHIKSSDENECLGASENVQDNINSLDDHPPRILRRRSSLYEDFKKDIYDKLHMFGGHK